MKYNDIMNIFSLIVAEKLNSHCTLYLDHMRSQSTDEIAHIDYVDNTIKAYNQHHLYRVLAEKQQKDTDDGTLYTICIKILYFANVDKMSVVWNDKGTCIFKKTYYKNVKNDYWVDNMQQIETAFRIRTARRKAKRYSETTSIPVVNDKIVNIVTHYVKRHIYRYAKNVQVFKENRRYYVKYDKRNNERAFSVIFLAKD